MTKPTKSAFVFLLCLHGFITVQAQSLPDLKMKFDESGKHYIQLTMLNQVWLRYNQSNPGTLVQNNPENNTFDIGLRRTRFQLFGPLSDRVFFYSQLGMNNFNAMYNSAGGNRKQAFFIHDVVCEYSAVKENKLKLGGGLTITNGLSRFSQPSIGTILTTDVPVFAQTTVDQTDQFSRKLSVYARGQIARFDYRLVLSDPFPISSNGTTPAPIAEQANFSTLRHKKQFQAYLIHQFFEHEPHTTPYMTGTYLGKKKVFNIAAGAIYQQDAMFQLEGSDTIYEPMALFCVESFLDMPLKKHKGSAVSAYLGYFHLNYGKNYLRYNGIMNPANGLSDPQKTTIAGHGSVYGNAFPMFGSGQMMYAQAGYLLPGKDEDAFRFLPYISTSAALYDRLNDKSCIVLNAGLNLLIHGHKAKLSLDFQNRPTYKLNGQEITYGARKSSAVIQYQLYF